MKTFYQKVDKRSRTKMIAFLKKHFRYHTMNSWNLSTSYANNLKVHKLSLPYEVEDKLYELMQVREFYDGIDSLIDEFSEQYNSQWQPGFNGRSGGYLVLYEGGLIDTGYKSVCTKCGQLNYKKCPDNEEQMLIAKIQSKPWVKDILYNSFKPDFDKMGLSEIEAYRFIHTHTQKESEEYTTNNLCGKCGQLSRVNLKLKIYNRQIYAGRGIDMNECFDDWDISELRDRVMLVQDFDNLCDEIVRYAIEMAENFEVKEKTIQVSRKIKTLVERNQENGRHVQNT